MKQLIDRKIALFLIPEHRPKHESDDSSLVPDFCNTLLPVRFPSSFLHAAAASAQTFLHFWLLASVSCNKTRLHTHAFHSSPAFMPSTPSRAYNVFICHNHRHLCTHKATSIHPLFPITNHHHLIICHPLVFPSPLSLLEFDATLFLTW